MFRENENLQISCNECIYLENLKDIFIWNIDIGKYQIRRSFIKIISKYDSCITIKY